MNRTRNHRFPAYSFGNQMNKRGWLRIVEAFIAILLIVGVLLVIINQGYIERIDVSSKIYDEEISVLREIELNKTLRDEVLNAEPLPVNWEDFEARGLENVKNKINNDIESYLECKAKICEIGADCELDEEDYPNESVYVRSVIISANLTKYAPRQLRLFCWMR